MGKNDSDIFLVLLLWLISDWWIAELEWRFTMTDKSSSLKYKRRFLQQLHRHKENTIFLFSDIFSHIRLLYIYQNFYFYFFFTFLSWFHEDRMAVFFPPFILSSASVKLHEICMYLTFVDEWSWPRDLFSWILNAKR